MKHPSQIQSSLAIIAWKASLVLAITLVSLQLWAGNKTGFDADIGFIRNHYGATIRTNLSCQRTMSFKWFRLGAEMKFPLYYTEAKDVEFAAAGLLVGARAGIKIGSFEPYVAANFGPNAVLYLSEEEGPSFPLSRSLDFVLKLWSDKYTAIYVSYNTTYNLMKRTIGTFGVGISGI